MSGECLSGLHVLEWGHMVAAPFAAKLLGDLGAEIIKVEPPEGDPARQLSPFPNDVPDPEASGLFLHLNTNKLSVTLRPDTNRGRHIFLQLVAQSDILIEDCHPDALAKLALEYRHIQQANPGIVMVSVTPFGVTGPYANYRARDLNVAHFGGEGFLLPGGVTDRPPVKGGGFLADYSAGLATAVAVLAAVRWGRRHGRGVFIDASQSACVAQLVRAPFGRYTYEGFVDSRRNRYPRIGTSLRCKDGYVEMRMPLDHMWVSLLSLMGMPEWAQDLSFLEPPFDEERITEINARLEEWTSQRTKEEVYRMAQEYHIPVGMVSTPEDVLNSSQLRAREFFQPVEHPLMGRREVMGAPWQFEGVDLHIRRAPLLGEQDNYVYTELLGLTSARMNEYIQRGVIV